MGRGTDLSSDRVQLLRCAYWEKVRDVEPKNMVFLDETGVMLTFRFTRHDGLMRHYARSGKGSRVYDLKPFYRGKKVTVIGAISMSRVLAVMTLDNSMDSNAFHVFIEKLLLPQLWKGAVVIMDNREHPTFYLAVAN